MRFRKTLTVLGTLGLLSVAPVVADNEPQATAAPSPPYARCWLGWENPAMQGRTTISGQASLICQSGHTAEGVPNINERILDKEIEATFQMLDPVSGNWVQVGPHVHNASGGVGRVDANLQVGCTPTLPGASRLWRVHVTYAIGTTSRTPGVGSEYPDGLTEFYGESGRSVELPCSA